MRGKLRGMFVFLSILGVLAGISVQSDDRLKVAVTGVGRPILFIPGLGCSGDVWNKVADVLHTDHTCHVVTLPGFAGRPLESEPSVDAWCGQLVAYLKDLNADRPIVVGHSLGGFLALCIATRHPELIDRLIIVDALPYPGAALNPAATPELMKPQAEALKGAMLVQTAAQRRAGEQTKLAMAITNPEDLEQVLEWTMHSDPRALAAAMYGMLTTDLRPELARLSCPTLVLGTWFGLRGLVSKEQVERGFADQYSGAPGVQIAFSDTSKHFVMLDEPEWLLAQIKAFVETPSDATGPSSP